MKLSLLWNGVDSSRAGMMAVVASAMMVGAWVCPAQSFGYYTLQPFMPNGVSEVQHQQHRMLTVSTLVNINTADFSELQTLPGMNENLALKIMRHRRHRSFERLEDLYHLPSVSKPVLVQFIEQVQGRVRFDAPVEPEGQPPSSFGNGPVKPPPRLYR